MARRRKPGRTNGRFNYKFNSPAVLTQMSRVLEGFGRDLADYSESMQQMPAIFAESIGANVASHGAGLEEPKWDAYSEAYETRKMRGGHGRMDLVYSGKLMAQVTNPSGPIAKIGPRGLVWKTHGMPYDIAVNFGRQPKGRHVTAIGAHRFWGLNDIAKDRIFSVIEAATVKKMAALSAAIGGIK